MSALVVLIMPFDIMKQNVYQGGKMTPFRQSLCSVCCYPHLNRIFILVKTFSPLQSRLYLAHAFLGKAL